MDRRQKVLGLLIAPTVFIAAVTAELFPLGQVERLTLDWWTLTLYWFSMPFIATLFLIFLSQPRDEALPSSKWRIMGTLLLITIPALSFLAGTILLLWSLHPGVAIGFFVGLLLAHIFREMVDPGRNEKLAQLLSNQR